MPDTAEPSLRGADAGSVSADPEGDLHGALAALASLLDAVLPPK